MVDFTEEETQALPAVMRALAPEMERIGWDRPLGQLTAERHAPADRHHRRGLPRRDGRDRQPSRRSRSDAGLQPPPRHRRAHQRGRRRGARGRTRGHAAARLSRRLPARATPASARCSSSSRARRRTRAPDFAGRSLRIFAIGHELEDLAIRWLRAAGLDLYTRKGNRPDGEQFGFSVAGGRIRGHVDGIVADAPAALGLRTPGALGMQDHEREELARDGRQGRDRREAGLCRADRALPGLHGSDGAGHLGATRRSSPRSTRTPPSCTTSWCPSMPISRSACPTAACGSCGPPMRASCCRASPPIATSSNAGSARGPSAAGACRHERRQHHPLQSLARFQRRGAAWTIPSRVEPDAGQIARFVDVVFGYCDGLIPVRGFVDKGQGKDGRPHNIWIDADATAPEKLAHLRRLGRARGRGGLCHPRHGRGDRARPAPRTSCRCRASWSISTPATSRPSSIISSTTSADRP